MIKLKMKKDWQKQFVDNLNNEINAINSNSWLNPREKRKRIGIIKDTLFLLGIAIDKDRYNFALGFDRFCEDLGIPELKGR